jgi:hypothetical protein
LRGTDLSIELSQYLQTVRQNLRLDPREEREILREIEAHVEDKCQEMRNTGLSEEEALDKCLRLLGNARIIARQIYEAHNQTTWRHALLAALPHLFLALLFTLNWFVGVNWLLIILGVVVGIAVYGWYHGKPAWLFPWLGYSLLPVVAIGLSLLYLPTGWSWVTLVLYIPLVLWLSSLIAMKFIRRDWLYSTLMLLPVPTFVGWFLASNTPRLTDFRLGFLYENAPWPGLTFLVLAVSVTLFIRLKHRWMRVVALSICGLTTSTVVILASNRLGLAAFCGLTVLMLSFLLVPAFVEHRVR